MTLTQKSLAERALEVWGVEAQLRQAQEELAELIVAINQFDRRRVTHQAVIDEIADVEIMCEQLRVLFGSARVDEHKLVKIKRLAERVDKAESNREPFEPDESTRLAKRMIELEARLAAVLLSTEGKKR